MNQAKLVDQVQWSLLLSPCPGGQPPQHQVPTMITILLCTAITTLAAGYLPAKVCLRNTAEEVRIYRTHKRNLGRELGTVDEAHMYLATAIPMPPVQSMGPTGPPRPAITQQGGEGEEDTPVDSDADTSSVCDQESSLVPYVPPSESTAGTAVANAGILPAANVVIEDDTTGLITETSPPPIGYIRCVTDGTMSALLPVQLQNAEMCVALPIERRNNMVRPNRHPQFGMAIYLLAKERFGLPSDTPANRLTIRKFIADKLRAHGLRPSHAHLHIDRITNRVFIPNREEIICADERRSWSVRLQWFKYTNGWFGAFRHRSTTPV